MLSLHRPNFATGATLDIVPPSLFGRDHWSLLAYLETVTVDNSGLIGNDQMRTNARRHRLLLGRTVIARSAFGGDSATGQWRPQSGTRLRGFRSTNGIRTSGPDTQIELHDDWDCLEDLVVAGLVEIASERYARGVVFGGGKIQIRLTPAGREVAVAIRAHKADGGTFSNFTLQS